MPTTLEKQDLLPALDLLRVANAETSRLYPGERSDRQPVHTVYGGAHLFRADTAKHLGAKALESLKDYAPDPDDFTKVFGMVQSLARQVYPRVLAKLENEAVEDFRIDFEDGYGNRPGAEEDAHAESAAHEVAKGLKNKSLPPYIGIRIKPFNDELASRSIRTLDIFLTALSKETGGSIPSPFFVTLPKVTNPAQVEALEGILTKLESRLGLSYRSLSIELMIELTQTILSPLGSVPLLKLVSAANSRCLGAHFGTYDYTASCSITAREQTMTHPSCDFAKHFMQVALGGTGVWLSDGATNLMPVGPHSGGALTLQQQQENREVVHRAWKKSYDHNRMSLAGGFYQGWDLHPGHLPPRYAALYAFFIEGLQAASLRLKNFMDKAAQATLVGDVFDDAATGQGLLNYFLRAYNCGAVTPTEIEAAGLSLEELRTRSFVKIKWISKPVADFSKN